MSLPYKNYIFALYLQTETSGPYAPARKAEYELLDGDYRRLPALPGLAAQAPPI